MREYFTTTLLPLFNIKDRRPVEAETAADNNHLAVTGAVTDAVIASCLVSEAIPERRDCRGQQSPRSDKRSDNAGS